MIFTKEHYELIAMFEKNFPNKRFDKEPREDWTRKVIYQDGSVNSLFLAFRMGYQLGKVS
jgi:hypothetical protein